MTYSTDSETPAAETRTAERAEPTALPIPLGEPTALTLLVRKKKALWRIKLLRRLHFDFVSVLAILLVRVCRLGGSLVSERLTLK